MAVSFLNIFLLPIFIALPAIILYFIIKLAVKHAIREVNDERLK